MLTTIPLSASQMVNSAAPPGAAPRLPQSLGRRAQPAASAVGPGGGASGMPRTGPLACSTPRAAGPGATHCRDATRPHGEPLGFYVILGTLVIVPAVVLTITSWQAPGGG